MTTGAIRARAPRVLAAMFATSGVVHLIRPSVFEGIVPHWLPRHRELVYVSGGAELACAAGLLRRRPWAGPASAGLLGALWPVHVQMVLDERRVGGRPWRMAALLARIPLQVPMIWAAWQGGKAVGSTR